MNTENTLYFHEYEDAALVENVMGNFQSSGLVNVAGIATSLINSGQQWLVLYFYLSPLSETFNLKPILLNLNPGKLYGMILCLPTF